MITKPRPSPGKSAESATLHLTVTAATMSTRGQRMAPGSLRFWDTFLRVMITLSSGTAIVLSSISVCDGHWLSLAPGGRTLGLWETCAANGRPVCSEEAAARSRAMVVARSCVCLALVVAIFALELLMVSQLCEDSHARRRWTMGALLLLAAFFLSAAGTLTYLFLLMGSPAAALTLTFWCQFLGATLFLLNAASGLYLNRLTGLLH